MTFEPAIRRSFLRPLGVVVRAVARSVRVALAPLARVTRASAAALGVTAVVTAYIGTAAARPTPFADFFGQFTMQTTLITAVVYLWSAVAKDPARRALVTARACVTVYLAITGLVYALLLAPGLKPGDIAVPWANTAFHVIIPIYAIVDWVVVHDRVPLKFRTLGVLLVFPVLWLAVTLVRGATDGWVPYPFLDPASGYGSVAAWCGAIFGIVLLFGALAVLLSRWSPQRRED